MKNPLRIFADINKKELPLTLLMFAQFFLLIACFWILKPLKKGLFIEQYDAAGFQIQDWLLNASQAELLAKELNLVTAFFAMGIFSLVARRFDGHQLLAIMASFMSLGYVIFSYLLETPTELTIWTFYLFGDLFHMFMVVGFFAFLNDSMNADQAKRLYGPIIFGGVLGGVVGSTAVRAMIDSMPLTTWLFIALGITITIALLAKLASTYISKQRENTWSEKENTENEKGGWFRGLALTFKSRYLLSITALVILYEFISVSADFQFTATTAHFLDGSSIRKFLSSVYMITNIGALIVQLFITGAVMSNFGVGKSLLVLPVVFILISASFAAMPVLWIGAALSVADNGLHYSINQSSREALYVVASKEEKYQGKAFIDIFVLRFAKATGVALILFLSTTLFTNFANLRWLSLMTLCLAILWFITARYTGNYFRKLE